MPKFTEEQLRTWSEYEEGWNADNDAPNPYDARTYPGRAWRLGFLERDAPEYDSALTAIQSDVRVPDREPEPDQDERAVVDVFNASDDDLIREVTRRGYTLLPADSEPAKTLSDYSSAELTKELERRGLEKPKPEQPPKCPNHPLREVTRRGSAWFCAAGHMFETPGRPMPALEEGLPQDCPDHPGSILDLIARNSDSNLYYCGAGQHHIRLSPDGVQMTLRRPTSEVR